MQLSTENSSPTEDSRKKVEDTVVGEIFFVLLVIACALLMILTTNLPNAKKIKELKLQEKALIESCDRLYNANRHLEEEIKALAGNDPFYIEGEIRKIFNDVRPANNGEGGR